MPRSKKVGRKENHHNGGGGFGGKKSGNPALSSAFGKAPSRGDKVFTLAEEAQNTGRQHNFWETDQRLRHTKVNFISAGALDSSKQKLDDSNNLGEPESSLADMTLDSTGEDIVEVFVEEEPEPGFAEESREDAQFSDQVHGFFIDTKPGMPVETGLQMPSPRATSPTPSGSSEEVILFGGRDKNGKVIARASKMTLAPLGSISKKIRVIEDRILEKEELLEEVLLGEMGDRRKQPVRTAAQDMSSRPSIKGKASISNKPKHYDRSSGAIWNTDEHASEDALIADYIANIDNGDDFDPGHRRDLGGTGDDYWLPETKSSSEEETGWNRDDIRDFDDLSTSDGAIGQIREILSKRTRQSGVQYLVVWDDQPVDEARWVLATTLSSINASSQIDNYEDEERLAGEFMDKEDDSSDGYDDISDGDTGDDEDVEADLISKKIGRMSDLNIARLLAKQEELGMGSEEILLFDDNGDDEEEDESIPRSDFPYSGFKPVVLKSRGHGKLQAPVQPRADVLKAGVFTDAYDGFDVMDFDRPSLKRRPKGRKGKLDFNISDSELEQSMAAAWDNDRLRKKERKQEREALRSLGLLGAKNGQPILKQKYKEGMGIFAVRDEIKQFLMGSNTTLSLPPMEKADRKVVHELANAFKLKSKSDGSGKKRHPVLYKTQQTRPFFEQTFTAVETRINRRFLPRMDVGGKKQGVAGTRTGGGFGSAAVSYRDGDVVGGSAPELGAENRGRAMLEKMGWSNGTALGALNNKGILQPVSHVVKTTKAGLG